MTSGRQRTHAIQDFERKRLKTDDDCDDVDGQVEVVVVEWRLMEDDTRWMPSTPCPPTSRLVWRSLLFLSRGMAPRLFQIGVAQQGDIAMRISTIKPLDQNRKNEELGMGNGKMVE